MKKSDLKTCLHTSRRALEERDYEAALKSYQTVNALLQEALKDGRLDGYGAEPYDLISLNEWTGFVEEYLSGRGTGYDYDGVMQYYREWFES